MAITLTGTTVFISGTETVASLYASADNAANASGVGVFMDRSIFANNVTTDIYDYTFKDGYLLEVQGGATFDVQQCALKFEGRNATQAFSFRNRGTTTFGTAQVINGVTYPDTSTVVNFAYGAGDWGSAQGYRAENGSTNNINCVMYNAGRRLFVSGGTPNWNFNARITGTHLDFAQAQLNVNGNVSGEYLELINPSLPNQAGPNAINWPLYPNNTFFNNISTLEMGQGGEVSGFSFNAPTFTLICVINVDKTLRNAKRLPSDFRINNGGNNNYGDIQWRNDFTGRVIDGDFNTVDSPVYYAIDTDNGNRNPNKLYPSDIIHSGAGNASGQFNLDLLMGYYGLTAAQFATEPTGIRPTDYRFPYTMSVYKYGYSVTTLSIDEYEESLNQDFISLADSSVTGTKAAALALTEINTAQELQNAFCAWQEENFTGVDLRPALIGDTIELGDYNLTIDPSAATAFMFDGSLVTINSAEFTSNITTTGLVTGKTNASGSIIDSTQDTTLTELSDAVFSVYASEADRAAETNALASDVTNYATLISSLASSTVYLDVVFGNTRLPFTVNLTAGANTVDGGIAGLLLKLEPPILETRAHVRENRSNIQELITE